MKISLEKPQISSGCTENLLEKKITRLWWSDLQRKLRNKAVQQPSSTNFKNLNWFKAQKEWKRDHRSTINSLNRGKIYLWGHSNNTQPTFIIIALCRLFCDNMNRNITVNYWMELYKLVYIWLGRMSMFEMDV